MARLFDTSNWLLRTAAPISSAPLVMACWFYSDDDSVLQVPMAIGNFNVPIEAFSLEIRGDEAGDYFYASTASGSVGQSAVTTTGYSVNTWHHGCGIFGSSTDRRAFIDGGSKGTDSVDSTPTEIDYTNYGVLDYGPGEAGYMSGRIAEGGIWDLSVWPGATGSDKADNFEAIALPGLSIGYSPLFFPLGLVEYRRFVRDEDYDEINSNVMTPWNSPEIAPHPPMMVYPRPALLLYGLPVEAGAAGLLERSQPRGIARGVLRGSI